MARIQSLLLLLVLAFRATAHFILQYPHSLGFDDDIEATAPCGGFNVVFNSSDDSVPAGGFPVSMLSTHPAADWLFRATLSKQAPFNWTNLLPVVSETGLGQFCIPNLKAPEDFAGQQGLLQVQQMGPDGLLFQCAAVNFVSGANTTVSSSCKNVTGLTATVTNENSFNGSSPSGSSSMTTSMPSSTASGSGTAASSTPTGMAVGLTAPGVWTMFLLAVGVQFSFIALR